MPSTAIRMQHSLRVVVPSAMQDGCPKGVPKRALSRGRLEIRVPRAILQNDPKTVHRGGEKWPLCLGGEQCWNREVRFISS